MTFVIPVVMMFLLGYAATNDVRNIALVVLDQTARPPAPVDRSRTAADYFVIAGHVTSGSGCARGSTTPVRQG